MNVDLVPTLHPTGLTRRTFLWRLAISSAALAGMNRGLGEGQVERKVRFGLIADVHQDLMPDGLERVRAFVKAMTAAGPEIPDPAVLPPDEIFDREWAVNVLRRALSRLEQDAVSAGSGSQFQTLKPWLTGERPDLTQAAAARELGLSEGAVRVAIYRLRKRFRELVKLEIGCTIDPPDTVDEELRHLVEVLARSPSAVFAECGLPAVTSS